MKALSMTGENYRAAPDEICVGVYAPGVLPAMLLEDFEATTGEALKEIGNG